MWFSGSVVFVRVTSLLSDAFFSVPSRSALIFLIQSLEGLCPLLFSCAKHLLGADFPGYSTVISVTPSLYIMFQRAFLLKVQLVFRYTWQVPQAVVH